MNYMECLDTLEMMVRDAKGVPLSASAVIPREDVLEHLRVLRQALPRETEEAREVLGERERVLQDAREEAAQIIEQARAERARLLARQEVVQAADAEAKRLVAEAEASAGKLKLQADDYVDAKLANFEILMNKVLRTVHRGREQLRQRLEAAQDELPPLMLEDSGEISGPLPATDLGLSETESGERGAP